MWRVFAMFACSFLLGHCLRSLFSGLAVCLLNQLVMQAYAQALFSMTNVPTHLSTQLCVSIKYLLCCAVL